MTPKQQKNLDDLNRHLAELYRLYPNLVTTVVNEALLKAKRLRYRLTVPEDAERVEFVQDRGPIVEFTGRKLFGKERAGHCAELWTTLSGKWIVLASGPNSNRAWIFEGDDCEPMRVLEIMGYNVPSVQIAKGMGWDKHIEIA